MDTIRNNNKKDEATVNADNNTTGRTDNADEPNSKGTEINNNNKNNNKDDDGNAARPAASADDSGGDRENKEKENENDNAAGDVESLFRDNPQPPPYPPYQIPIRTRFDEVWQGWYNCLWAYKYKFGTINVDKKRHFPLPPSAPPPSSSGSAEGGDNDDGGSKNDDGTTNNDTGNDDDNDNGDKDKDDEDDKEGENNAERENNANRDDDDDDKTKKKKKTKNSADDDNNNKFLHITSKTDPDRIIKRVDLKKLITWVHYQRTQYRLLREGDSASTLTPERVEALLAIDFQFHLHKTRWDSKFGELKRFKERFGHCNVPPSSDGREKRKKKKKEEKEEEEGQQEQQQHQYGNLNKWVHTQRKELKKLIEGRKSLLNRDRMEKLISIGFAIVVDDDDEYGDGVRGKLDGDVDNSRGGGDHYDENNNDNERGGDGGTSTMDIDVDDGVDNHSTAQHDHNNNKRKNEEEEDEGKGEDDNQGGGNHEGNNENDIETQPKTEECHDKNNSNNNNNNQNNHDDDHDNNSGINTPQQNTIKQSLPRMKQLPKIKISDDFNTNNHDGWYESYSRLRSFKGRHGHCLVPPDFSPDSRLALWTHVQRTQYRQILHNGPSLLNEDMVKQLGSIGFGWTALVTRMPRGAYENPDKNFPGCPPEDDVVVAGTTNEIMNGYGGLCGRRGKKKKTTTNMKRERKMKDDGENTDGGGGGQDDNGSNKDNDENDHEGGDDDDDDDDDNNDENTDGGNGGLPEYKSTMKQRIENWESHFQALQRFKEQHGHCLVPQKYVATIVTDGSPTSEAQQEESGKDDDEKGKNDDIACDDDEGQHKEAEADDAEGTNDDKKKDDGDGDNMTEEGEGKKGDDMQNNDDDKEEKEKKEKPGEAGNKTDDVQKDTDKEKRPKQQEKQVKLGWWCNRQRVVYRYMQGGKQPKVLTHQRIGRLNALGFVWDVQKFSQRQRKRRQNWGKWFVRLETYAKKYRNGDCNISLAGPFRSNNERKLARWISAQRSDYRFLKEGKKSIMTKGQVQKLETIGLKWTDDSNNSPVAPGVGGGGGGGGGEATLSVLSPSTPSPAGHCASVGGSSTGGDIAGATVASVGRTPNRADQEKWNQRYEELKRYKEEHGDCLVPSRYKPNGPLGVWVGTQREQYKKMIQGKKHHMTLERKQKLEELGFVWCVIATKYFNEATTSGSDALWQERYDELKEYKAKNGDCLVPARYGPNPKLGTWVGTQREQYKRLHEGRPSHLTMERTLLLEELDFVWVVRSLNYVIDPSVIDDTTGVLRRGMKALNPGGEPMGACSYKPQRRKRKRDEE